MSLKKVVFILLSLLLGHSAQAAELYEDYYSLRAVGMGDAYTALVSDDDAIFYNPASLCKASGLSLVLADASVSASGFELLSDASSLASASTSNFASTLQQLYGHDISVNVGAKTAILVPCFEVAVWGNLNIAAKLDNPTYPSMYVRNFTDAGAAAGFGLEVLPKLATLGFAFRRLNRLGAEVPLGLSTLGTLSSSTLTNQLAGSGVGYAMDAGFNLSVPAPISPTLTAVYKNIGNTTFIKDSTLSAPPTVKNELIVGAGFAVETLLLSIRPTFDFKHVTEQNVQLGKKMHAGLEIALPLIALRGGLYQGYYTAGVGLNLGLLEVNAATWGVEMGEYPGQDESRRYGVEAKLQISFDANFGLLGRLFGFSHGGSDASSGKQDPPGYRRHLKQRR